MSASRQDILSRDHTATTVQAAEYFETLVKTPQKRRGLGVQDPRDMVFAHLGIAGTINESDDSAICRGMIVDYESSTKEVYEQFAYFALKHGGQYDLLQYVEEIDTLEERNGDLASWCPDWTSSTSRMQRKSLREAIRTVGNKVIS
jgi:hypothetical protein